MMQSTMAWKGTASALRKNSRGVRRPRSSTISSVNWRTQSSVAFRTGTSSTASTLRWRPSTHHQRRYPQRLQMIEEPGSSSFRLLHPQSHFRRSLASRTWPSAAPASSAEVRTDEEDDDAYYQDEVERYTQQWVNDLLPRHKFAAAPPRRRELSSLDLELGEGFEESWYAAASTEATPEEEDDDEPPTNLTNLSRRSAADLLLQFDPQNPPSRDNLPELQLFLECQAQQESVLRYQSAIDAARQRKDYGSLSLVQRQIVQWFQPLHEAISQLQKDYLAKEGTHKKGLNVYGPFLCTLTPEKLAVIAAHEAVLFLLLHSHGDSGKEGVAFASLVRRIGEAVEEEVVVQRMLFQRFKEATARDSEATPEENLEGSAGEASFEENVRAVAADDGDPIETELADEDTSEQDMTTMKWAYSASHLKEFLDELNRSGTSLKKRRLIRYAIRRARRIAESEMEWTEPDKIQVGTALFQLLLNHATVRNGDKEEMAFSYEKRWFRKYRMQSMVKLNDSLFRMVAEDKVLYLSTSMTRYKPMILPPKPWTNPRDGGYVWLKADLMRYHGSNMQREAMQNGDLSTVYEGLNALGKVPWKINRRVLDAANRCWEMGIPLGDIPSRKDFDLPPVPIEPSYPPEKLDKESLAYQELRQEIKSYRESMHRYNRMKQKNMDLRSQRCSALLKLDQAEKFKEFESIYFPYNMDFRGRAYPIPPHLSNIGSDLCRGMLMFAESKPLGSRGLYWMKVHLANFAGADKMSFDERAKYVDDRIHLVRESAEDPFGGEKWWIRELDDPFQGLAACIEIINAIDSGDPASYECSLPVHMDGSCNGLQHYAALGRDKIGGKAVNLCNVDEPQDVYIGVMHEVIRRVAEEAERDVTFDTSDPESLTRAQKKELNNNRAARLVNGLIDRGVVKRTVMTSVYGVTYIGARTQIQEKIEEKLEAQGHDIDEISREVFQASGYLAKVTMDVMGDLFSGARQTMNWLTTCARMISEHGYPVAWISPIGLPAVQPYRRKKSSTVVTLMQVVTLANDADDLPIHRQRQVSAFPPNYVHSLDSSHMLLTALEMEQRGLTFSAVHDSFWTHACDIDEMNEALRGVFVELYDQPLLENLKKTWEMRYPDLQFPDLPKRGDLKLEEVKDAKYFFQ